MASRPAAPLLLLLLALDASAEEDARAAGQLHAACARADWEGAAQLGGRLAATGHAAWEADSFALARGAYEALLHGACGCNGTSACGALGRRDQLQVHANLGSSLMLLAREPATPAAERAALLERSRFHWSVPLATVPDDEGLRYFHALVQADAASARALADALPLAAAAAAAGRQASVSPIERVDAASLSRGDFLVRYALPRVPVILTGLAQLAAREADGALPTLDAIVAACAERSVRLQRRTGAEAAGPCARAPEGGGSAPAPSLEWAGLEAAPGVVPLGELAAELRRGGFADGWQLFDWALPRHCPEAAALPAVQRWLPPHLAPAGDDLLRSLPAEGAGGSPRCALAGGWPSLFLQPAGTGCGAHVDSYGSHFFQLVLNGTKRWRIARPEDAPLLEPLPPRLRALRVPSLFAPAYSAHPQLRLLALREAELRAGELLFVPAGSPHQVLNGGADGADGTLVAALSANYVDGSNAAKAARELYYGAQLGQAADVACTHAHVRAAVVEAEAAVARAVASATPAADACGEQRALPARQRSAFAAAGPGSTCKP